MGHFIISGFGKIKLAIMPTIQFLIRILLVGCQIEIIY